MAGLTKCCVTGFKWGGTPEGKEGKLATNDAYISGTNKDAAVLLIHDLYGWKFPNLRLLSDHFAKEANVTVYLPDFFGGESIAPDVIDNIPERQKVLPDFISRNTKEIRRGELFACARALKSDLGFKRVGAVGYCYGGWAVFQLGAKERNSGTERLVDCISMAHPSLLEKSEIDNVAVPVQIMAPEIDEAYTPELKEYSNKVIPTLGVPYDYQYFPGVEHSFAVRGNQENEKELRAMVRAKAAAVHWFRTWLHE